MKIRMTIFARAICLACSIFLTGLISIASAQSGRVAPTPTPQAAPSTEPEAAPKVIPLAGRDKYKLVFAPGYSTAEPPAPAGVDKRLVRLFRQPSYPAFDSFMAELNKVGEQGYRLVSSVQGRLAILKSDEAQYQYVSFVTVSDGEDSKVGFLGRYTQLAKLGYRLVSHSLYYKYCDSADFENAKFYETCEYKDFFLTEKGMGVERPGSPRMVFSVARGLFFGRDLPPHADVMTTGLREVMSSSYLPTAALSRFEILVEQPANEAERTAARPEVRVLRSSSFWGSDNVRGKINEAAQQGFRLALIENGIAVMYRQEETPATYVWVEADNKRTEERLAKLQASGAIYRMIYPDSLGRESIFVFEQKQADDGRRREYKLLRLELQSEEDRVEKKVRTDLSPSSKETMKEFDRLVKEGFVVRDLFISGYPKSVKKTAGKGKINLEMYGILLERVK